MTLTYVDTEEWDLLSVHWSNAKILDVRDASEYWEGHIPGSVNISVGRLPVVWRKDLSPTARILARRGFHRLYAVKDCYLPLKRGGELYERK